MKALLCIFAYNDGNRIRHLLSRIPENQSYDALVLDDGSTDGSLEKFEFPNVHLIRMERNYGIGHSMRKAFRFALQNEYKVVIIMAGNGKDDPSEIPRLLAPIVEGSSDFVQGSRFLSNGAYQNMPLHRIVATKSIHPFLFSLISGTRVTESTNGFRAFRTSILRDPRINWEQDWLNGYEMEQYLHYKVVRLGYKRTEVPVSKIYPPKGEEYSKVKPVVGWWHILRPLILLPLGLKK